MEETLRKAPNVKEFNVYEKSKSGCIMYSYSKMPALITDRDMLLEMKRTTSSEGKLLIVLRSIDREDLVPLKKGCIRMDFYKSSMAEEKDGDLHILEF